MAVDMFLEIAEVPGESSKKGHEGQIDIISFNFGAVQHGSFAKGGAGGGARRGRLGRPVGGGNLRLPRLHGLLDQRRGHALAAEGRGDGKHGYVAPARGRRM